MKLRDSLAVNKSIRLQAEAETWQDAVKIGVDLLVRRTLSSRAITRRFWMAWNSLALISLSLRGWRCRTGGRKRVLRKPVSLW
ncbi:ascorbate-specific PTS system EIIA component [Escherichia coli]|uniref:Ascorbate-specific PTS system EIIA component n=1 Tax=Escherichia coli TaxID=562 RepID=A0A3S4JWS3_ECOLX|nr:ascorbate-specific PTS system EIIA component [Escherichia coli]